VITGDKMIDKVYWQNVVNKLNNENEANWAAHVLASNIEIIDDILSIIGKETFIKSCLLCYSVDFSTQPYLDEILSQFSWQELIEAYKELDKKPIKTAGALMWLLEDIDPGFKWAIFKE
jgi:hypothetical protein